MFPISLLIVLLQTFACHVCGDYSPSTVDRKTPFGDMRGKVFNPQVHGLPKVEQFLGIKYTDPALTGKLRFDMPNSPSGKWDGEFYDATKMGSACIQNFPNTSDEEKALKKMPQKRLEFLKRLKSFVDHPSEDCLSINIYVPQLQGHSNEKFPILVFVHGESYEWNTGNAYDGSILAAYGKLMVVTVNYRLGPHGFLSSGRAGNYNIQQGNMAVSDLLSAIEMAKLLAPDLHGDRDRVTLMGAGTGGALVHIIMNAPIASQRPSIFKRVILLGGCGLNKWAMVHTPIEYFYLLASYMGCKTFDKSKRDFEKPLDVLDCMKNNDSRAITMALAKMPSPSFLPRFGITVDGIQVMSQDFLRHLQQFPDNFRAFDLLVGFNEYEAWKDLSEMHVSHGINDTERRNIFRTLVRNLFSYHRTEIVQALLNHYTDWKRPNQRDFKDEVLTALSDGLYAADLLKSAQIHAKSGNRNSGHKNTFMYLFKRRRERKSLSGEDVQFIFGYPLIQGRLHHPYPDQYDQIDKQISEAIMNYIANFAKTG